MTCRGHRQPPTFPRGDGERAFAHFTKRLSRNDRRSCEAALVPRPVAVLLMSMSTPRQPDPAVPSPNVQKAFEFAQEAAKQLITLSTPIIALTVTFLTDVVEAAPTSSARILQAAWVAYFLSIVAGVFVLLNLAGNLERPGENATPSQSIDQVSSFSRSSRLSRSAWPFFSTLVFGWLVS